MTPDQIAHARALTPGCAHHAHLNNAGAALMPQPVLDAQITHLESEARHGGYEAAALAQPQVHRARHALATLLNCGPDDLALVDSATTAWRVGLAALDLSAGDEVLLSRTIYASNYLTLLRLRERRGVVLRVISSTPTGEISLPALQMAIRPRTRLIALDHMPTNSGLINPAQAVGAIARAAGVPFFLDACQTVGQLDIDVRALGCDLLSGTGRKFLRGPRGTGFLYIGADLAPRLRPPHVDLYAARWHSPEHFTFFEGARRFEQFEFNHAARVGLGAAVDHALSWGMALIESRVTQLAGRLRSALAALPGVRTHDLGSRQGGIVTFTLAGHTPDAVTRAAAAQQIHIGVSPPWGTLLDTQARALGPVIRASVHYYNTDAELHALLALVSALTGR